MRGTSTTTSANNVTMSGREQGYYPDRSSPQGLTLTYRTNAEVNLRMQAMRSRLKSGAGTMREVSERKQVGDAEGMVNEESAGSGASSEALEQL
jgi:hypothetical protein